MAIGRQAHAAARSASRACAQDREAIAPRPALCLDCGLDYQDFLIDTILSDADWAAIHPDEGGLLCASCIARRVAKLPHTIVLFARIIYAKDHDAWAASFPPRVHQ